MAYAILQQLDSKSETLLANINFLGEDIASLLPHKIGLVFSKHSYTKDNT